MVDYHYIKRGNKVYGPYYYHSYREGGKVKKRYLGKNYMKKIRIKKRIESFTFIFFILLLFFFLLSLYKPSEKITGNMILNIEESKNIIANELLKGNLTIILRYGELLPSDAVVRIDVSNDDYIKTEEKTLKEVVDDQTIEKKGNFYLKDSNISGHGYGYGVEGYREIYPVIYFTLNITQLENTSDKHEFRVEGSVIKGQNFVYNLSANTISVDIVDDSIYYYNERGERITADKSILNLNLKNESIVVTTNYSYKAIGFGSDFITEDIFLLELNISNFYFIIEREGNYKVDISLIYHNITLLRSSDDISVVSSISINHPPLLISPIPNITIHANNNFTLNLTQYFTDIDNDILNFSSVSSDNVDIKFHGEMVWILPRHNWSGSASVRFIANDAKTQNESNKIIIDVINNPPYAIKSRKGIEITKNKEASVNLSWYFFDEDNDKLSYNARRPENITVIISQDTAILIPDKNFAGKRNITFYATDGINTTSLDFIINVSVLEPNTPPIQIAILPNITIEKNKQVTINLSDYFFDDDKITYNISYCSDADILEVILNTTSGEVEIIPQKDFVGNLTIVFAASDMFSSVTSNIVDIFVIENITSLQPSVEENLSIVSNVTNYSDLVATETLIQHEAVVGKPVKWTKKIILKKEGNISIKLPIKARNIIVKKLYKDKHENAKAFLVTVTGAAVALNKNHRQVYSNFRDRILGIIEAIKDKIMSIITGHVVYEISEIDINDEIERLEKEGHGEIELKLEGNVKEYEIEYETPAPQIETHNITKYKKRVKIFSDFHYTNITAFTSLPEIVPVGKKKAISLYSLNNEGKKNNIDFKVYDNNSNGIIDGIEWKVPHLSSQTYEVAITIINVQSYPTLKGNWTVYFNTTGEADLTITAINGTTWNISENCGNEICELKFIRIACEDNELNYTWISNSDDGSNDSVFIANFSCAAISLEESQVLRAAKHTLMFQFGSDVAYAFNDISPPNVTLISPTSGSVDDDGNVTFKFKATDDVKIDNCTLYTNISGIWEERQTNTTMLNDTITEFIVSGIKDDTGFIWNVLCYDNSSNFAWADSNWSITVNSWYTENISFLFDLAPIVNLTNPEDSAIVTTSSIVFTFNVTETFGLLNCSLYHNITSWSRVDTNITPQTGNNSFIISNVPDDTTFIWNIKCYDTSQTASWGEENRTLTVNLWHVENVSFKIDRPPRISWYVPAELNTSVFNLSYGFNQNITVTDYALKEMNCTIYSDANLTKAVWSVSFNITGNTSYTKTSYVNTSGWEAGIYYEKCVVSDILVD